MNTQEDTGKKVCGDVTCEVRMWEEMVIIPTYETAEPDKNPLFLEKRVYQGSSGKVYPLPVIEKIFDVKVDKAYQAVFLENEFLQVMILPELGGRIQRALDKTNQYDFVYYNHVIKPALVGLAGPWISGGIEFNWPQHHRPSTFMPVDYQLASNIDRSKTVWVGEIDRMYGTKGLAGFTLRPGKAYIEISGQVFNSTDIPQTFLWWANPAVPVNDHTFSIFPPDVHAVMDHGKRAVSSFPIATGEYYKFDYSAGVDISRYKNVAVPTSYMAYQSEFDFVGNYDEAREAGLLHVADHHVSPGKKQWTWGNSDFGQAWDRNLTDEDGPYIELMTGIFTDNQPDFTWLKPYEQKSFKQYFMPIKRVGHVKNATIDAAVNLEQQDGIVTIIVYATARFADASIRLNQGEQTLFHQKASLSPCEIFEATMDLADRSITGTTLEVRDNLGRLLVAYSPVKKELLPMPDPAEALPAPEELKSTEELYLAATHLEQYRHATFEPADYYRAGLQLDPSDIRLNHGLGLHLYRQGDFEPSERHFRLAISKQTWKNPNPYLGESYLYLGLVLLKLGREKEAFDAFFKATWSGEVQSAAFYQLGCLSSKKADYAAALEFANLAIAKNAHNTKAHTLKAAVLRQLEPTERVDRSGLDQVLAFDPLNHGIHYELGKTAGSLASWQAMMRYPAHNYLALALDYMHMGFDNDALEILEACADTNPLLVYYQAYIHAKGNLSAKSASQAARAAELVACAETMSPDFCFPNRLEEILILEQAINLYPGAGYAHYYLGNLLYDKKQYARAIKHWEAAISLVPDYAVTYRNLSLAYFNKLNDPQGALSMIRRACAINPGDARLLLELNQLLGKLGCSNQERLGLLTANLALTESRDDLFLEYITLLNSTGQLDQAFSCMVNRKFHPWEGGEGKVSGQYVYNLIEKAKLALSNGQLQTAIELLQASLTYPDNLGEGKLPNATDNITWYYLGLANQALGRESAARQAFEAATAGETEPGGMMYYNDQPADLILYQGLACGQLGQAAQARSRYNKLIRYGEKHIFDQVKYDYFAVSLPDTMIYEDDIQLRNQIYCIYLIALGKLGLGDIQEAREKLEQVLSLSPMHQGAIRHLEMVRHLERVRR